jgi:hypothetical protein
LVIAISTDADLLSKFVSLGAAEDVKEFKLVILIAVDAVKEFTEAVPALNALILIC